MFNNKKKRNNLAICRPPDLRSIEPTIKWEFWDRIKSLLGQKVYIECGHCGGPITGERKKKMTKIGKQNYMYYRPAQYHKGDRPRIQSTESDLDSQMLEIFDTLRVDDDE